MKPVSFALKEALREREAPRRTAPALPVRIDAAPVTPAPRPGSWIARHWRGELTLTQSYWINMGS